MNTFFLKVLPVRCFVKVMNKAADTAVVGALGHVVNTVALHLGHVGHTHTSTSRDCFHGLHKETNSGKGIALHKRSINIKII